MNIFINFNCMFGLKQKNGVRAKCNFRVNYGVRAIFIVRYPVFGIKKRVRAPKNSSAGKGVRAPKNSSPKNRGSEPKITLFFPGVKNKALGEEIIEEAFGLSEERRPEA